MKSPHLKNVNATIKQLEPFAEIREESTISYKNSQFAIQSITLGNRDPKAPCLILVAGIHGVEVIGIDVLVPFLNRLASMLRWDRAIHQQLEHLKLVILP